MTRARPPWWALASSIAAPVFLIGGWSVAQAAQPSTYDPLRETISALARHGLDHRWIMTVGLVGLGVSHVVTALGLPSLPWWSRALLAFAGLGTLAVAAFAQPYTGSSTAHVAFATAAFVALALWPASAATHADGAGWTRRPVVAITVTAVSAALLIWVGAGGLAGLSERLLAAQQALWPLVTVLALRTATARMTV